MMKTLKIPRPIKLAPSGEMGRSAGAKLRNAGSRGERGSPCRVMASLVRCAHAYNQFLHSVISTRKRRGYSKD